jgi:hypothetical protein
VRSLQPKSVLRAGGKFGKGALVVAAVAAVAGCSGSISSSASKVAEAKPAQSTAAASNDDVSTRRLRLLTASQLQNTMSYVFGTGISVPSSFAPVTRNDGLIGVGTAFAGVTSSQIETYQKTAASVDALVMSERYRNFLMPCTPKDDKAADDACARTYLSTVGRLLYRRPLEPDRLAEYVTEANEAATRLKNFYTGLGTVLEGMLISPRVLLVSEQGEPDPKHPGRERLDAYSLASRLSFFLWNAAPDAPLLAAAASGELQTPKGFAKTIDRMLASPRLEAGMRAFFDDMFQLDDFNNLAKDGQIYPAFTGTAVQDAREQTLRTTIDHLLVKNMDYRDLFTSRDTFISPSLAAIYKLPTTPGWVEYEFPKDSPRIGLVTQIGFLAAHSHPGRSSPTLRGKALREILLCQTVPRPPANVDFSALDNPDPNIKTQRERVALHLKNPVCAGCHKIMDPTGLALENFDGAGQYRTREKGALIDASGTLDGHPFKDVEGLAQTLHDHPALPACLVKRVYAYAVGSPSGSVDPATLEQLDKQFASSGYRLRALLRSVVTDPSFTMITEQKKPVSAAKTASATAPLSVAGTH